MIQVASDVPDQIQIAETYIDGTEVFVEWDSPFSNYKPILEYEIIFLTHVGTYINIEPECNGQDPSLNFCQVEMSKVI